MDVLDVIVTSSGRDTVFATIESFLKNVKYSGKFRFIVNIDLCIENNLNEIVALFKNLNIKYLNVNHKPLGFTRSVSLVLKRVETPFYFHLEDDWLFLRPIEIDPLIKLMENCKYINHIRFSKEKIQDYDCLPYSYRRRKLEFLKDIYKPKKKNRTINGINLVNTINYSTNPNISRTTHFQNRWHLNSLNIEQQFCLQNLLLFNTSGYYIFGKIGDSEIVKHIG